MTSEEKRLARYRRYNESAGGRARREKYEAAHPERKDRWAPMERKRSQQAGLPPIRGEEAA